MRKARASRIRSTIAKRPATAIVSAGIIGAGGALVATDPIAPAKTATDRSPSDSSPEYELFDVSPASRFYTVVSFAPSPGKPAGAMFGLFATDINEPLSRIVVYRNEVGDPFAWVTFANGSDIYVTLESVQRHVSEHDLQALVDAIPQTLLNTTDRTISDRQPEVAHRLSERRPKRFGGTHE